MYVLMQLHYVPQASFGNICDFGWGAALWLSVILFRLQKIRSVNTQTSGQVALKTCGQLTCNYGEKKVLLLKVIYTPPLQTAEWWDDEMSEWWLYLVKGDLCGETSICFRQLPPSALFLAPLTNSSGCERPIQLVVQKIHYQGIKHARWEQFSVCACVCSYQTLCWSKPIGNSILHDF